MFLFVARQIKEEKRGIMFRSLLRWLAAPLAFLLLARLVGEAPTDLGGTLLCIGVYKLSEFIGEKVLERLPPQSW